MKALVLVHNGFEEAEMVVPVDIMRRAGIDVTICSMDGEILKSTKSILISADKVMGNTADGTKLSQEYDLVMLPGGGPNAFALRDDDRAIECVKAFAKAGKYVCAICAAPIVLEKAGILDGRNATSYTDMLDKKRCIYHNDKKVVADGKIITACGPGASFEFGYEIVKTVCGEAVEKKLKKEMLF